MEFLSVAAVLIIAALLSLLVGPGVYLGLALGIVIDRLLIVPGARVLARHGNR